MPTEMLTRNERKVPKPTSAPARGEAELREWARAHVERVRRVKLHVVAFVVGMVVGVPLWALVEWQDNGAFERFSNDGNPGDWEPWILYVALIWGLVVAMFAVKTYFDRPATEAEIDRELERLSTRT